MKSNKMKHYSYECADQPMAFKGLINWRSRHVTHSHSWRCYSDSGEFFKSTRTIFKAKVRDNEDI